MPRCVNGHEALADDRFCGQCGWVVPAHCPFGHLVQPDHGYCGDCGAALNGGALGTLAGSSPPPVGAQPAGFAPAPGTRHTRRWATGSTTAAVVAGLLVLGAAGVGSYVGATAGQGQAAALSGVPGTTGPAALGSIATRSVSPPLSPGSSVAASAGVSPTTVLPSTVTPFTSPPVAPAVSALPGLASLTGEWTGHGGDVHIGADGQGQVTFRAYRFCNDDPTPPCDTMSGSTIVDGGHAQFRLKPSSAPGTATGQVTSSNDPEAFLPGFAMTVNLMPGDVILVTSSPGAQSVAYCGSRAAAGACGA